MINNLKTFAVDKLKTEGAVAAKKKMEALVRESGLVGEELAKHITVKNLATGGLYRWCDATIRCYEIYKDVEPKRLKAEKMKKQKE
jgi:hypothetical protein